MRLVFLGTSAGAPTRERNVTSHALVFDDGRAWLVDCGEGTQHRLLSSELRPGRIDRILVTHVHGDHLFGLPGLLCSLGLHGRTEPLEIVGPVGVREFVETALRVSSSRVGFPLAFTELTGPVDLGERHGVRLSAFPIAHRVECFGYVVREPALRGHFDAARAHALGVPPGPLFGALTRGERVRLADGREIDPSQVMGPPRRGRVAVLLGDTSDPSGLADAALDCDVLVHEATYDEERHAQAVEWGHSTARMAGAFAARVRARLLVITHFSGRFTSGEGDHSVGALVAEARAACPGIDVVAASDGLVVPIPHRD